MLIKTLHEHEFEYLKALIQEQERGVMEDGLLSVLNEPPYDIYDICCQDCTDEYLERFPNTHIRTVST